jgi:hypothetical protein
VWIYLFLFLYFVKWYYCHLRTHRTSFYWIFHWVFIKL